MDRNRAAHIGLDRLGFPHKVINAFVLEKVQEYLKTLEGVEAGKFRVLDVGCGSGHLLKRMLARGWYAWGVDPFPRGEATKPPLRERVICGTIENVRAQPFHVITAVEVLEHVEDYMGLLTSMSMLLQPQGFLVASVPNNWETRTISGSTGTLEPMYGHLWRFCHDGFKTDLECFFDKARVEPIYSRNLDRRMLRISRILPKSTAMKLSRLLVRYINDGAWLLGTAIKERTILKRAEGGIPAEPSGKYYEEKAGLCPRVGINPDASKNAWCDRRTTL
jgi:2-polyprenyl-3-methyl-5-hydroxy-6-metoxy-1,4-benzoquinol methylase